MLLVVMLLLKLYRSSDGTTMTWKELLSITPIVIFFWLVIDLRSYLFWSIKDEDDKTSKNDNDEE